MLKRKENRPFSGGAKGRRRSAKGREGGANLHEAAGLPSSRRLEGGGAVPDRRIARFTVPASLAGLPEDVRARILEVQEKAGFVPNVFLLLARRPAEFRAFMAWHDALMEKDSGLSRAEREMIVVVTSAANRCLYCVVAHGAILRIRAKDPILSDILAVDWRKAGLGARERAMLAFAEKLALRPWDVEDADIEALKAAGFGEDEIWDIGAITALFAASNRIAHFADLRPNPEFYPLGRTPRG